ncbi:SGNH/GDSL hydrolase family protein [Isobaculum melis]|uniref:Lysophospholipase L1 n=1 Tax=Isobaculum melis TaxID=142588 RepID=A0A1H9RWX5_9LACT|nr:SGNH/GDSL hydrolase family protein [Isobaculum melis]SER77197.1 Lysophospholipase L1 [Isobaculum melis]
MKKRTKMILSVCVFLLIGGAYFIYQWQFKGDKKVTESSHLTLVSIGDSLTEGVGDGKKEGGYVGLLTEKLKAEYPKLDVSSHNYGISGERSDQILERIKEDEALREAIEEAQVISITVGGNDVMKTFKSKLLDITEEDFEEPGEEYQERIQEIFDEIRSLNSEAAIFILGIYNPFYVYFPEITELQSVIDHWNEGTEKVVNKQKNAYFVPINDLLEKGDTEKKENYEKKKNKLLFEEDNYHPNEAGYEKMAERLFENIVAEEENWH